MNAFRHGWTASLVAVAALAGAAAPLAANAAGDAPQGDAPQTAAARPMPPAACGPCFQHGGHDGHGWHRDARAPGPRGMFRELGLTGAQRQSVRAIMQGVRPEFRKLHEQMRANSTKLGELAPDDKNYPAVAADVARESGALFTQFMEKKADMRAKLYAVLTPAQKQQLAQRRAEMRAHRRRGCAAARD